MNTKQKKSGRRCQVTGRGPIRGKSYTKRGIAKKKKGIGLNITGIVKRNFRPNIFKKRYWLTNEKRFVSIKLSAAAMRTIEKRGVETVVREMRAKGIKL